MVDKTSGRSVRENTQSEINKVLMSGKVPDRGGRLMEIPPPDMPSWQQRSAGGGGGGGGHRGGAPHGPRQGGKGGWRNAQWENKHKTDAGYASMISRKQQKTKPSKKRRGYCD